MDFHELLYFIAMEEMEQEQMESSVNPCWDEDGITSESRPPKEN